LSRRDDRLLKEKQASLKESLKGSGSAKKIKKGEINLNFIFKLNRKA